MKLTKRIGLVSASLGLTACTSLLGGDDVKVRPLENMSTLTAISRDPLYESAVTAIDARDYARALDYLQEARARDPRNFKALNALGVVYDKLGRFDLSARYYAQARAIDPESRIVAQNMGYSNNLQGLMSPGQVASAIQAPISRDTPAIEKPAILASASQPADLHAMSRENRTALPVNNNPPVDKRQESKVLATEEFVPVGKPVHLDIFLPDYQPLHKPMPLTEDVLPAASKPAPSDIVLATNKPSHENKLAAPDTTLEASNASPLAEPAPKESSASKPAPETKAVAENNAMPASKLSQEGRPLVANTVARVTSASSVTELAAKVAAASMPIPETRIVKANEVVPVSRVLTIVKPVVKEQSASKLVAETKIVAANETARIASASPASKQAAKETSASKPIPETKIVAANEVVPTDKSVVENEPREVALPAQSPWPVIRKMPASIALAANKPSKVTVSETVLVQKIVPISRPEPVKVVAPVKKSVLAMNSSNSGSLRENKIAPAIKVATPVGKVLTIGQPVRIFNASGKGIEIVLRRLSSLGWSVRQIEGHIQQATMLYYPVKDTAVAKAMQRTLPFPIRLVPNPGAGMRLVVGRDYLSWKPRNARLAALWKKGLVVAFLQKTPPKGVR